MRSVICTYCNREIYQYSGPDKVELKAKNFVPTSSSFTVPKPGQDLRCPNCFVKFKGFSTQGSQIRMLIDWSYKGTGEVGTL